MEPIRGLHSSLAAPPAVVTLHAGSEPPRCPTGRPSARLTAAEARIARSGLNDAPQGLGNLLGRSHGGGTQREAQSGTGSAPRTASPAPGLTCTSLLGKRPWRPCSVPCSQPRAVPARTCRTTSPGARLSSSSVCARYPARTRTSAGGGGAKKGWGTSLDIQKYPETHTHTHDFWGPLHSLAVRLAVEYWECRGRAGLLGCTLNEAESQVIGQDPGARSGRPGSAGWAPVPGRRSGSLSPVLGSQFLQALFHDC